jgi:hypothetical protein
MRIKGVSSLPKGAKTSLLERRFYLRYVLGTQKGKPFLVPLEGLPYTRDEGIRFMNKKGFLVAVAALGLFSCSNNNGSSATSATTSDSVAPSESSQTSATTSVDVYTPRDIYAAPHGSPTATGTEADPYDLITAIKESTPGHTLYLTEGTYVEYDPVKFNSETEAHLAKSEAETKTLCPVKKADGSIASVSFNFSAMTCNSANRGLSFNTNYWHAKDFEVYGAGDNGVYIGGNHNTIEHLRIHDNQDTGLQLGRIASDQKTIDTWPSDNTILNCTFYNNFDPTGENADGFACKLTTGYGNRFEGCISYNNSDDGWDLYTKAESGAIGPVTLKDCVAFNNGMTTKGVGTANSDGNGFKLGGESIAVSHKVINCLAFDNCAHGFTDNSNPGTISLMNCTSYNNGVRDWDKCNINLCRDTNTSYNDFTNVLSYCEGNKTSNVTLKTTLANSKDQYKGRAAYSVFYVGLAMRKFTSAVSCNYSTSAGEGELINESVASPFVSAVDPQPMASKGVAASEQVDIHTKLRASDGSLALGDLFKLKSTSIFASMGEGGTALGCNLAGGNK